MKGQHSESILVLPMSEHALWREFTAPCRVNLLGEHTDYTGGFVLPMAIPFFTIARIASSSTAGYSFSSERFPQSRQMDRADRSGAAGDWSDYSVGVLRELQALGIEPPSFAFHLRGDVPIGAGLSSSASVEVASALAILAQANVELPAEQVALLCQRAENNFAGSPCGIMDQLAVTAAQANHALLLDTRTLHCEHIPLPLDVRIVVCNSMVKHSIAEGEYGMRRREVEAGQKILCATFPHIGSLRDATLAELESCRAAMPLESFLRCRHIITENLRVLEAKETLLHGDNARFGELMLLGHASERDDFACSCPEVDFLVDTAASLEGCFGARLTGGGFGGCTVNLVAKSSVENFSAELKLRYQERFHILPEIYVCEAVDGAMRRNAAHTGTPKQESQS
jgi:galactokinase